MGIASLCLLVSCRQPQNGQPGGSQGTGEGSVMECALYSTHLKQEVPFCVWLPIGYDAHKTYPFLYLLHGIYYGEQDRLDRSWLDKGDAASIATAFQREGGTPMVIVMPNGYSSFYVGDYEAFFEEELIPWVEKDFGGNGLRAIAGLSMGGFGALYHALKYPERFTCAYAMSPVVKVLGVQPGRFIASRPDKSVFPSFIMEVGTEDVIVDNDDARELYEEMVRNGLDCEWIERPGGHTWAFWKESLPKVLRKADVSFRR